MRTKKVFDVSFAKSNSINFFMQQINKSNNVKYKLKILNLIKLLLDENVKAVPPLDERTTYILRKRYGVLDNGQNQTLSKIASEFSFSTQRVSQILEFAEECFLMYIFRILDENEKISSLELSNRYDEYKIMSISQVINNPASLRRCIRCNIFTLYDLLTFSKYDLNVIMGEDGISIHNLEKRIQFMDLKFIDELNSFEKRQLIRKSSKEKILLSSSWLIDGNKTLNKYRKNTYSKSSLETVRDVLAFVNYLGNEIDDSVINWFIENNFEIDENIKLSCCINGEKSLIADNLNKNNFDLSEILKIKVFDLNISNRSKNALLRYDIETVGDIIKLRSSDLSGFKNLGVKCQNEIIDMIHSLGLYFINEIRLMKFYTHKIYKQLNEDQNQKVKTYNI